jgi:Domain of unknown function (DUF4173)
MNGEIPPPFHGLPPSGGGVSLPLPSLLPKGVVGKIFSAQKNANNPPVRLSRLLLSMTVVAATSDLCFWGATALGFSLAIFCAVLSWVILANRDSFPSNRTTLLMLALLAGAIGAAVLETGITNTLILLVLIAALAGDTFFRSIESAWGRWLSQVVALLRAPGRVFWLASMLIEASFSEGLSWTTGFMGMCLLTMPALVLALIFGTLLASGNVVFGTWMENFFNWFWTNLLLYLDPVRITLWFLVAFLALPFLRPVNVSTWWWSWTHRLPRLPEVLPTRAALFNSVFILTLLNLLFLVANVADALFLWSGEALPQGVTYSSFVHSGVNSLTVTVILSAFVLTTLFQQASPVSQRHELKWLGYAWIVQNLFLLMSVALRLKLYIEAYDMTVLRLSVIIFLALVAAGYLLLTIKIARDRSLSWLVGGCILAMFTVFYIAQFLDLAGCSANYNVARWEKDRTHALDTCYLVELGPPAWPAARRAHDLDPDDKALNEAWNNLSNTANVVSRSQFDAAHWREFSLRAWLNRWAIEKAK